MKQQITENEESLFFRKNYPGVSSDLKPNAIFHSYQLDQFIFVIGVVRWYFSFC